MRGEKKNMWLGLVDEMDKAKHGKEVVGREGSTYVVDKMAVINDPVRNTQQFSNTPMYEGQHESTHLMADDNKNTAWPTIFQDEGGDWFKGGYNEAKKSGELYNFNTKEEMSNFAREGNWKKEYGGDLEEAQWGLEKTAQNINKVVNVIKNPTQYIKGYNFGKSLSNIPINNSSLNNYSFSQDGDFLNKTEDFVALPNGSNGSSLRLGDEDVIKMIDHANFSRQSQETVNKIPLTRVLNSKGLRFSNGKLFSSTEPHTYEDGLSLHRNTTHWSYGHISDPGHGGGNWVKKSTAIISDYESLKKSGTALDLDPTDTYFYSKGNFEIPVNSLILTRDPELYYKIKNTTNIKNIKLFENTPNAEFEAIVNSYGTRGGKGAYTTPTDAMINPKDQFHSGTEGEMILRDHLIKNYSIGKDVALYKQAKDYDNVKWQGHDFGWVNPFTGKKGEGITTMHPDFDHSLMTLGDPYGGGQSKAHSGDPLSTLERLEWNGYDVSGLYSRPVGAGVGQWGGPLEHLMTMPMFIQINEMDKLLTTSKNIRHALEVQQTLAELNGFASFVDMKNSITTDGKMYRGIGEAGKNDLLKHGFMRPKQNVQPDYGKGKTGGIDISKSWENKNETYFSPDFAKASTYSGGYIAEVDAKIAKFINKKNMEKNTWSQYTKDAIPKESVRILKLNQGQDKKLFENYKELGKDTKEFKHGGSNHHESANYDLAEYKKGGQGMWANIHAKRKRGDTSTDDRPSAAAWASNTKAEFGMELQGEEINDRYADDPTMETSGGDVSDGMRKGGTVYNRRKYSTGAEKYRRGGESLPKYQKKGSVIEFNPLTEKTTINTSSIKKNTLEEKRKSTSVTGEYYDGVLSGHEIGDIFDFKIGNFKAGFSADHPDVLEWRSVKGFSADKLLNWYYETQVNIPYHNYKDQKEDVKTFNINDKSTWEGKNYGYQMGTRVVGSSGVIGHANENTNWYPTSHSIAHAMSRDLIGATDQQIFFYNGQPFTNEEGDEKDVRLGLKAGEQMADLEFRISNANSRSEVTEIMKEFNKNINLESLSYINNKRNPLKLKDGTLMALESILEDYRNLEDPNDNDRTETQFALHNELAKVFSGTNAESGPIIDYVKNILDGNLDSYFDDHVSELANHSELAQFRSKKELDEWTKSTEFKQGSWNPNNISYVGADGQIVTGKDIILPYNTMYHAYKPYETDENGEWPIDDFDGKPQYRIYNKEQALETNLYPISSFDNSGNSVLGGVVNWATGQDFKIPTLWGGSGADLSTLEIPVHNPYKKTFEYYDYDKDGIVIKTHTFDNPTYNSDASVAYRKMMGNNGDGKGGTITTNMHGNDFLNFMHPNSGPFSTESLELGSAIHQNPYYTNEDAFNTDSKQATQPHQFLHMSPEEVNQRFVDISGKNANSSQEWNGLNWAGAPLLGTQVLRSGLLKAASWKTAGNTVGKYWTERGKFGWLGSAGNTLGYTFKSGEKIWDATSIGRIGGASVPYTGGLININNFMIGKWTKDHLTKSYDQFGQGDIWGGTKDLAFGALSGGMLYNRLKRSYSAQNMFNYGKFPDLRNPYTVGNTTLTGNKKVADYSNLVRDNVPAWSLRSSFNNLTGTNTFKPQVTQGLLKNKLDYNLTNNMYPNVTQPSLLPPNYRLGDGINKITP